ncbi:hypothetical protein RI367_000628 [Sorochytrium milnesiophthora]
MSSRLLGISKRKLSSSDTVSSSSSSAAGGNSASSSSLSADSRTSKQRRVVVVKQTTLDFFKALKPKEAEQAPPPQAPPSLDQLEEYVSDMLGSATKMASSGVDPKGKSATTSSKSSLSQQRTATAAPLSFTGTSKFSVGLNGNGTTPSKPLIGSAKSPFGAKKLVIRDLKVKPVLPPDFEQNTWQKLHTAILAIEEQRPVSISQEELYKACESLCHHKFAASLLQKLQAEIRQHVSRLQRKMLGDLSVNEDFLRAFSVVWTQYCQQMSMIRSIFLYLDRTYVLQSRSMPIWDYALHVFKEILLEPTDVQSSILRKKLVTGTLHLIEQERRGESVQQGLLKSNVRMLVDLQLYLTAFEPVLIGVTNSFYAVEASNKIDELNVSEYLIHIERRLAEEVARAGNYLDASSTSALLQAVEKNFIETHYQTVLEKGFDVFMRDKRLEDLSRLFGLLRRVNKLDKLRDHFFAYACATGAGIVKDEQADEKMVDNLLDFKSKMDSVVVEAFQNNESFVIALKDSFEKFINERKNKPAEYIAKFVDRLLRSNKTLNEEEVEITLDKVLLLFRFIQGKDTFEAFYKKDLSKRLLLGKTTSIDAEKGMLARLKNECGPQFTQKLEKMFTDIDISRELMATFKKSRFARSNDSFELNVTVLQDSVWPTQVAVPVKIPDRISRAQDRYTEFYLNKNSGRRLTWQNHLGHCTISAHLGGANKELQVSVFQASILLLFNELSSPTQRLSFTDIKDALGLESDELKRQLQSLACGKVRVLVKVPSGKDVDDTDEFEVNEHFKHPQYKIKINQIQIKETKEEQESTHERVQQDRSMILDAAIVRLMKTRKTVDHTSLYQQLISQIKFPISKVDFKKRVESLIERDFMERDKEDANLYKYIA